MKNKVKIFLFSIYFLASLAFYSPAHAFNFNGIDFTASVYGVVKGVGGFFNFFSETVISKVRNDFCENYFSAMARGEWKADEFRAKLGASSCSEKTAIKIDNSLKKSNTPASDIKVAIAPKTLGNKVEVVKPKVEKTTKPVVKAETSGLLLGSTEPDGVKLNTSQILYWTNLERTKMGQSNLKGNSTLDSIALARVNDMFEKGYFEHTSPTGDTASLEADKFGYKYIVIGENIALGNFDSSRALVDAWMASEGHKKNILNSNYTEIGISAKEANYKGSKVWISAQIFAKPLDCSEPSLSIRAKIEADYANANTMKSQVQTLLNDINSMNASQNPNLYNSKVAEYNTLANSINKLINEMKTYTDSYNSQVRIFNECIKLN